MNSFSPDMPRPPMNSDDLRDVPYVYPTPRALGVDRPDDALHIPQPHDRPIVHYVIEEEITVAASLAQLRSRSVGFNAVGLVIDNPTGQWFYSPQLRQYIAPFILGLIRNIVGGAQSLDFIPQTPTGASSNAQVGQRLSVTAYSIALQPADGIDAQDVATGGLTVSLAAGSVISPIPLSTSAGWLPYFNPALSNTPVQIGVGSQRKLGGIQARNGSQANVNNAADTWLQIFDSVGAPTVGTNTPVISLWLPPGGGIDPGIALGLKVNNQMWIAATTQAANGVAPANAIVVNAWYV